MMRATSEQFAVQERDAVDAVDDNSDSGTKAFAAQEWEEADSLLKEALRVLQQIPKQQRTFCDIFGLRYKLAVCAYHIQEPADADEAFTSLVQQSASSDDNAGTSMTRHTCCHVCPFEWARSTVHSLNERKLCRPEGGYWASRATPRWSRRRSWLTYISCLTIVLALNHALP